MQPVHVIDVPLVCVHALCMYVFLRYAFINITFHVHEVINPRRACAGGLQYLSCVCVCVSVCLNTTSWLGLCQTSVYFPVDSRILFCMRTM